MSRIIRYNKLTYKGPWKAIVPSPEFKESVPEQIRFHTSFVDGDTQFLYDSINEVLLVPESLDREPSPIDLSNWEITRVSINRSHHINDYTRSEWIRRGKLLIETGVYKVCDGDSEYEVEIYYKDDEYYPTSYIRYPERLDYTLQSLPLKRDDEFFELIFRYNGETYKKSDSSSQP